MGHRAASPNRFSGLILAQYDNRSKIAYAGLVGTGLSEEARGMLLAHLHALKRKTCPCVPIPVLRDHFRELRTDLPPQWVKRCLSCRSSIGSAPGKDCVTVRSKGCAPISRHGG